MKTLVIFFLLSSLTFSQNFDAKWLTEFEKSDFLNTADYETTMKYFKQFADDFEEIRFEEFGESPQERKLYYLIVDKEKKFDPSQNSKPVILIENGIHSGEIEGKDACKLLLREVFVEKKNENLFDDVVFIVVPIFNVDGHERKSKFNRINQNGPEEMGWRTTAQNINLNRDFTKADAPEMKALLKLFSTWKPEIFIDSHTTNGLDYQYVMTYGIEKYQNTRPSISDWVQNEFIEYFETEMANRGYLTSPYFSYLSKNYFYTDPRDGLTEWVSSPRFSHGYAAYQNRIGLLLETHMSKAYKERVYATKTSIEVVLDLVNSNPAKIKNLIRKADEEAVQEYYINKKHLPTAFESTEKFSEYLYKGYEPVKYFSEITGSEILTYSNDKFEEPIKYYNHKKVIDSVSVPNGYIIPKQWKEIVDIMKLHGIETESAAETKQCLVERYKFTGVEYSKTSYEGRQTAKADYEVILDTVTINKGDYYVSTNQSLVPLIVYLLEPKAPDSFLQWGFFNSIFERKEYFEFYSMEPIAVEMLNSDEELKNEFYNLLETDENFKTNPYARLSFFYERSPYYDEQLNVYPVLRVIDEL
ncbi:hypothetical protein ASZ90_004683 [hydrocarbon metagenome]|uniref:Peptidase M14 domain-containing protein n=1 Tax=hydrocarbon metagenome TaxID=938273 RepID=A0A0W8FXC9_9ZZZZ